MLRDKETGLQYNELIFTWLRNSTAEWQNVAACGAAVCGRMWPSFSHCSARTWQTVVRRLAALICKGKESAEVAILGDIPRATRTILAHLHCTYTVPTHLQFVYNHLQHTEHANANTHMWARLDSGHIILHQHEYNVIQYHPMSIETVNFNCPIKHHDVTLYDMASQSITGSIVSV